MNELAEGVERCILSPNMESPTIASRNMGGYPPPRPRQDAQNQNPTPVTINRTETKSHARKLAVFSRDRKTLEKFLRDCLIFITSNKKDFQEERTGTQFILSYINGGEADSWKEFFITSLTDDDSEINWLTVKELTDNLRENFAKEDQVEESLRKLKTMKQNGRTAEEVVNEF